MTRLTTLDLRKMKADSSRIAMVTAYDATMARLVDRAGVDMILVGDSLGMVVQGATDTLGVTLDHVVYHTRCVSRAVGRAHVTADMPFGSYQISPEEALRSATRLLQEGGAQSVKLEGGAVMAPTVARLVSVGIPVVGHVGLTPQSVHAMGGFRVQGRNDDDAERIVRDAVALEEAGAFCVVLEAMPLDVAAEITTRLTVPTIGIGAGPHCDGQVLVCNDLLGMDLSFEPRFVRRYARLEEAITGAVSAYVADVRGGAFPTPEHAFARRGGPRAVARLY
jgi:3-methyl-2-oxobutanoate hydroxymethyltransferase